jgi:hypothetical protein
MVYVTENVSFGDLERLCEKVGGKIYDIGTKEETNSKVLEKVLKGSQKKLILETFKILKMKENIFQFILYHNIINLNFNNF